MKDLDPTLTTAPSERIAFPVPVEIKNWAPSIKPPYVKHTTVKTYIVDPAGSVNNRSVQICDYEPKRFRMTIQVIDSAIALTMEPPITSPDTTTASLAPQGLYLPPNVGAGGGATPPYEFNGPDAMWLNPITAVTRVSVVKEYC